MRARRGPGYWAYGAFAALKKIFAEWASMALRCKTHHERAERRHHERAQNERRERALMDREDAASRLMVEGIMPARGAPAAAAGPARGWHGPGRTQRW